jgi:hypothetical protein
MVHIILIQNTFNINIITTFLYINDINTWRLIWIQNNMYLAVLILTVPISLYFITVCFKNAVTYYDTGTFTPQTAS